MFQCYICKKEYNSYNNLKKHCSKNIKCYNGKLLSYKLSTQINSLVKIIQNLELNIDKMKIENKRLKSDNFLFKRKLEERMPYIH